MLSPGYKIKRSCTCLFFRKQVQPAVEEPPGEKQKRESDKCCQNSNLEFPKTLNVVGKQMRRVLEVLDVGQSARV